MMVRMFGAVILTAAVANVAVAEQQTGDRHYTSSAHDQSRVEQHVATCLILANLKEIELSKFAKEKVDDDDVEDFAKKMVKEHKRMVSKLEKFAPHAASVQLSDDDDDNGNGDDDKDRAKKRKAHASKAQMSAGDKKLFTIQRRAAEKCVSMLKKEMKNLDDDELAKAYVGAQVGAHIAMLAELSAAERSASGELKEVIKDAKEKVKDHLEEAKDLKKELKES